MLASIIRKPNLRIFFIFSILAFNSQQVVADDFPSFSSAGDVVNYCSHSATIDSLRSAVTLTVKNDNGDIKKNRRFQLLYKAYPKNGAFLDKIALFTLDPAEFKDNNYLRWSYSTSGKTPDQWVYLEKKQKVTRLSPRDPADLSWGLIGEDLGLRRGINGQHRFLKEAEQLSHSSGDAYLIETIPDDPASAYSKIERRYQLDGNQAKCRLLETNFYGKDLSIIKTIKSTWQTIDETPVRKTLVIEDKTKARLGVVTEYQFSNVELTHLDDKHFTKRAISHRWKDDP